jgi:excisionase family DNA binding protein
VGSTRLLTTKEVASILGITPAAVRRAIRNGRLPAQRVGTAFSIAEETLYRWLAAPAAPVPATAAHAGRESWLRQGIEQMADAVFIVDQSGRWRYWNHAAAILRISDTPYPDACQEMELAHPRLLDDSPCPAQDFPVTRALRGEVVTECDLILTLPGYGERVFSFSAAPLPGPGEQVTGAMVMARPVGSRARRERLLYTIAALFATAQDPHRLLDRLASAIARVLGVECLVYTPTPDGTALQLQASAPPTTIYARFLTTHPLPLNQGLIGHAAATGEPHLATGADLLACLPFTDQKASADARALPIWAVPLHYDGRTLAMLVLVGAFPDEDESDRQLMMMLASQVAARLAALEHAANLQWQRSVLEALAADSPCGFLILDGARRVQMISAACQQILGLTETPPESALTLLTQLDIRCPGRDGSPFPIGRLIDQIFAGELRDTLVRLRQAGGQERYVRIDGNPIRDAMGTVCGALLLFQDDTRRWRAERQRDEFLSVASHELRAPLTAALGYTQIALRHLTREGRQDAWEAQTFAKIERQLRRLNRLTLDLLEASRANAGRLRLRLEYGDLGAVVGHAVEELRVSTGRTIVWDPPAAALPIYADLDRIAQVIHNLLANAIRYSPASRPIEVMAASISPDAGQDVGAIASAGQVLLVVRDYGCGIAPADLPFIFDRFYRAPAAEEGSHGLSEPQGQAPAHEQENIARHSGLGLGLYIAREIIEQHGGRIVAESAPGQGTTMRVWLPRAIHQ